MRLIFIKDGVRTVIPREDSPAKLNEITCRSAFVVESMQGGIPVSADGGEYFIVNEDLSEINIRNFIPTI